MYLHKKDKIELQHPQPLIILLLHFNVMPILHKIQYVVLFLRDVCFLLLFFSG